MQTLALEAELRRHSTASVWVRFRLVVVADVFVALLSVQLVVALLVHSQDCFAAATRAATCWPPSEVMDSRGVLWA